MQYCYLTFDFLLPSRAPLLLLFCLIPPVPPVLHLLLHPALLRSSRRMTPSLRRAVRHPSTQRCLPSSTRAWISLKVGYLQRLNGDKNIMSREHSVITHGGNGDRCVHWNVDMVIIICQEETQWRGGDISVNLEHFNHTSLTLHSRIKHTGFLEAHLEISLTKYLHNFIFISANKLKGFESSHRNMTIMSGDPMQKEYKWTVKCFLHMKQLYRVCLAAVENPCNIPAYS